MCFHIDCCQLNLFNASQTLFFLLISHSSPVDGRGSSVQRQDGWVVDDGAVRGMVDDIHGYELGTERHDVELCAHSLICLHHLCDGLPLDTPPWKLEHWCPILLCRHRWEEERELRVVNVWLKTKHVTDSGPRSTGFAILVIWLWLSLATIRSAQGSCYLIALAPSRNMAPLDNLS